MQVGNDIVIWAKVRPDAIIPTKRDEDAGYDLYANFEHDFMTISPHQTILIPTGIASAFSNEWYAQIEEKGGVGSKGIGKRAGVIDSGFRGEWFLALTNYNPDKTFVIYKDNGCKETILKMFGSIILHPYDKALAQAVIHPVTNLLQVELAYVDLLLIKSERGTGSRGSSNK